MRIIMYPETLLVIRNYKKTVTAESEIEEVFPEVKIDVVLVCEYVWAQKVMKFILYKF